MKNSAKRVLITGITGMVGSHLVDFLLENTDWEIYGMCRWRSPLDNISHLLPLINKKQRIQLIYADLRDSDSINEAVRISMPDFVFHLAAQSYPKTSFTAPLDTYETNIQGTSRVLESLKQYKKDAIIHVCASSEVFGRVPKEKLPINEECGFHPASPYAISKVGTDLVGRFYAEAYNMTVMTTRMFTHTGPRRGDVFAESSFAKQIAMIEAGGEPIIRVGNLDSLRTFADVRDAVRAYYMLVTHNPIAGAYYNIGGTYTCTIHSMLNHLISLSSKAGEIKVETDPDRLRPIDADLQVPDTTKFFKHTGWKTEISFEQTMQDLLDYWRNRIKEGGSFLTR
jgi:GDP-mannose 4,6-dehydratase